MHHTLREVAQYAGVNQTTVLNVMNGNCVRVSPETIRRVRQIATKLGYVPSAPARSHASQLIGMLVQAASEDNLTISPHAVAIVGQIERELRKYGYHLLLRGVAKDGEIAEMLHSWSLEGVILLDFLDAEIDNLTRRTVGAGRVLAIDSYSDNPLITGTRADDFTGAREATRHLLELGHRRIVFAGPALTDGGVVRERFTGYRQAFLDVSAEADPGLVETVNTTYVEGRKLGLSLGDWHPDATAVFATADVLAIGIIRGLAERGVDVPGHVSVVGFGDLDLCHYVTPRLTTVAQDLSEKAAIAVRVLVDSIENNSRPEVPVIVGVSLVVRESTGPVRRPDEPPRSDEG